MGEGISIATSVESKAGSEAAIPAALNLSLAGLHLLVNLYQFFLLPLFLLPQSLAWGWTLLPLAALNNAFWSLIHEAVHDIFHPSQRVNLAAGRILAVFFGSPFRVLRLSHLLHHKLNRTPTEATEIYDPEKGSRARAAPGYYFQIFGGLYFFEIISPLPLFMPRPFLRRLEKRYFSGDNLSGILVRSLMKDESVREIRADGMVILVLFGLSALSYGGQWPFLVGMLALRAFFISFLDNVYHYNTPVNDIFYARNLRLPAPLARLILHFNLHGIHHRKPSLPWAALPRAFQEQSLDFDGGYLSAALSQLAGPIAISELPSGRRR